MSDDQQRIDALIAKMEQERLTGMPRWNVQDHFRVLVTGSRDWPSADEWQVWRALASHYRDDMKIIHGACPTGVDLYAQNWADAWRVVTERHPADWALGDQAGPMRNQAMVDLGAELCLAFPLPGSKGTHDCVARALRAGISVFNHGTVITNGLAPMQGSDQSAL